jgi:pyrroline-5-carboxylate reductase
MAKAIGIIGFGNMGSAIAGQIKSRYAILVFDKDKNKTKNLSDIKVAQSAADLVNRVEVVILAVKPQDFAVLIKEIKNCIKGKLVISIAAGISTAYIEKALEKTRVIRAMPNIGIKIGESITCLSKGGLSDENDFAFAQELFYYLGVTKEIKEELMNAATVISGSGPAYIFDFIESNSMDPNNIPEHTKHDIMKRLERAAEGVGFNSEDAMFLAVNTTNTSISLVKKTGLSPSELKKQVTSKGGTTEAALEVLHKGGSWEDAAVAGLKRAEELSKKE